VNDHPKETKGEVSVTAAVKRRVCHSFTKQHFEAARYFAGCAASIEDEFQKANLKDEIRRSQHQAYVVGAIVLATMAMESCINEIYFDACGNHRQKLNGLDDQAMVLLAKLWPKLERNSGILPKYRAALQNLSKTSLDQDSQPYKDADSLVELRNTLTHYKPEWDDAKIHEEIRARLDGKFAVNPLAPDAYLWFPHQCLGSGCAKWAVSAAEEFVRAFCEHLGIPRRI